MSSAVGLGCALRLLEEPPTRGCRCSTTQWPSVLLILHLLADSHRGLMNGKGRWPVCFSLGRVIYFCVSDAGKTAVNLCRRVAAHQDSGPLGAQPLFVLRKMHHLAGSLTSTRRDRRRWPPALGHRRGHVAGCDKPGGKEHGVGKGNRCVISRCPVQKAQVASPSCCLFPLCPASAAIRRGGLEEVISLCLVPVVWLLGLLVLFLSFCWSFLIIH